MMPTIRAEFRKLLTVRSTYVITACAFILIGFVAFYGEGLKAGAQTGPDGKYYLADSLLQHANVLAVLGSIVALLLMTHEFRYNTVTYTLTAVNNRTKVLAAKALAVFSYVFVYALIGGTIGLLGIVGGMHLAGHALPTQHISLVTYFAKMLFFCEGWAFAALLFATLLRNQIAALAVLIIGPNTVETLLGLLLKQHAVYLPFAALNQVVAQTAPNVTAALSPFGTLSPGEGALVFLFYMVIGWWVTWVFFMARDIS